MSALLITIARTAVGGQDALSRYAAGVMPLIQSAGGHVICRMQPTETVVGRDADRPDLVAVMRFESPDAIRSFLDSNGYRQQVPHRARAFREIHSYIAVDL